MEFFADCLTIKLKYPLHNFFFRNINIEIWSTDSLQTYQIISSCHILLNYANCLALIIVFIKYTYSVMVFDIDCFAYITKSA